MDSLAIVRSVEDLPYTCKDLADFFSVLHRRRSEAEGLLGIWIDPQMATMPPEVLAAADQGSGRPIRVMESVSLAEVWTLCWLAAADGGDERRLSRRELLGALLEASRRERPEEAGRFIPVFAGDREAAEVAAEMDLLQQHFRRHTREPLLLDLARGRLAPLEPPEN